jgi:hypothetical protein
LGNSSGNNDPYSLNVHQSHDSIHSQIQRTHAQIPTTCRCKFSSFYRRLDDNETTFKCLLSSRD